MLASLFHFRSVSLEFGRMSAVRRRMFWSAVILLFLFPTSAFAACTSTWKGGTGSWDVAANWTPSGVPTSASNTCINVASSTVTINGNDATSTLTLGTGTDSLTIANAEVLKVSGSTISNAGTITLNSIGNVTELLIGAANVTLSGAGTLTMSNNAENFIFGTGSTASTNVLTNQSTIQGAGNIGDGQMELNNSGTINANQSAGLTLQLSNIGTTTTGTNTGMIEATGGNTLTLLGGIYANAGGTILNNASTLVFSGNVIINGGTITQTGAGTIKLSSSTINTPLTNSTTGTIEVIGFTTNTFGGTSGGALTNPAGGQVKIDNGGVLIMGTGSSISNAGTITLNSIGNVTELLIGAANVTLSGAGTLTMSNNAENFIFGTGSTASTNVLTNQSTIQGAGNIGDGQMELNNSGTINANQSAGLTLQLSNIGTTTTGTNTGMIEATGGNTLTLLGGIYANAGGTILNNASTLVFSGNVIINGGTITQTGAGTIKLSSSTINTPLTNSTTGTIEVIGFTTNTFGGTSGGALTNPAGGQVKIDNGGVLIMGTGSSISNAGTITLNSIGNVTELLIGAANVTLSGAGTLTMSNNAENFIFGTGSTASTNVLTNQSTIQGAGNIGDGQMELNNSGTINANQSAGLTLQLSNIGTTTTGTNTGTIEATGGNTLTLLGGIYANAGGTILNNASTLVFSGNVIINGGTITQKGAGTIKLSSSTINTPLTNSTTGTIEVIGFTTNTFGGTSGGALTNPAGGQVKIDNGGVLIMGAGSSISNAGKITLNSMGNVTELQIGAANVTLSGAGTLTMSNNAENFIFGVANTNVLTNQSTIQGAGNIGNGSMELINSGTISAIDSTTLFIDTNSTGFTNNVGAKQGTLSVAAHDTLTIEGGPFNNFSGTTLTGGIYKVSGTLGFAGANIVTNAASITLTGTTAEILNTTSSTNGLTNLATNASGSTFALAGGAKFNTFGNFTNNGTLNVGSGDKFSTGTNGAKNLTNYSSGTSTLTGGIYIVAGTGQIQFNNGGNASDIVTNAANITLSSASTTNSFIDQNSANALAHFATNASTGSFTLSADRNFTTGGNLTNAGTVTVMKSTGTGSTALIIGGTGVYSQTGGTTTVDGRLNASGGINISGGFLYGNAAGITNGNQGTLVGNVDLTGGTLNPGDGLKKIGDLNITGTYTESGAATILNIDLNGTVANTKYDVLNVSGKATLGGTITIDLITGFVPVVGDNWDVLNYASETGSFTTVNLPTAPTGDHYVFSCGATDCTLALDAGPAPASKGAVSGAPATRVSRNTGAVTSASTHEPVAILSRATCFAARLIGSAACGKKSGASVATGGEMHATSVGGGAVHNNIMVATRSISAARGGASRESSASAAAMARLYVCAYLPASVGHTMGCN